MGHRLPIPQHISTHPCECGPSLPAYTLPARDEFPEVHLKTGIFDLKLGAAPADLKIIPMIDVPTSTPGPAPSTASVPPASETNDLGIQMVLEQVADLGTGYLLNGYLTWTDPKVWIIAGGSHDVVLKDAGDQTLPMEPYFDLSRKEYDPTRIYPFSFQTQGKGNGALTLTLDRVSVNQNLDIPFEVDLGDNIQEGQVWELNREFDFHGDKFKIVSMTADSVRSEHALSFVIETTGNITAAAVADTVVMTDSNQTGAPVGGGGGGGGGGAERVIPV